MHDTSYPIVNTANRGQQPTNSWSFYIQIKFDPQELVRAIKHTQTNNKVGCRHKLFYSFLVRENHGGRGEYVLQTWDMVVWKDDETRSITIAPLQKTFWRRNGVHRYALSPTNIFVGLACLRFYLRIRSLHNLVPCKCIIRREKMIALSKYEHDPLFYFY